MAVGGGSAERKAEELAASGDASAGAWAAGAEGERRAAAELARLSEAWTVLHDRLLSPGRSPVNLDHVVVGPAGAFLIDAKNWRGAITAWEGNLFQHTGGAEARQSVSKHQEVAKVHGMAAFMAAESGLPVTPVICLAGRHEDDFGDPQLVRGVWVVPASRLTEWLAGRPGLLDRAAVERASVTLMTSFPSTTTDPLLLSAMGTAVNAAQPRRAKRARRASSTSSRPMPLIPKPRRRRSAIGRMLRVLVMAALAVVAVNVAAKELPDMLDAVVAEALGPGGGSTATEGVLATPSTDVANRGASPTTVSSPRQLTSTAAAMPVVVSTCGNLSAAQVGKILGRTVQPIASQVSCAWGTRLDDPRTTLVTLQTKDKHAAYETNLEISASQRRTVFGATHINFQQATGLWVAAGQPIGSGSRLVTARYATQVAVSTHALEISDDRARALATKVAVAANAG